MGNTGEGKDPGEKEGGKFGRIPKKRWMKQKWCGGSGDCGCHGKEEEEGKCIQVVDTKKKPGIRMKLAFQVADVKKPLIAVKRIAEQGNWVQLGPAIVDNFIETRQRGAG